MNFTLTLPLADTQILNRAAVLNVEMIREKPHENTGHRNGEA
jgi:hypothetical protein